MKVEAGEERFDDAAYHSYSIIIYEVKDNFVSGQWKEQIKDKGAKASTKKGVARIE